MDNLSGPVVVLEFSVVVIFPFCPLEGVVGQVFAGTDAAVGNLHRVVLLRPQHLLIF